MRSVKPLPRRRYSVMERLRRAERDAEVALIAARGRPATPRRGDPPIPARHASSIVAILDAPRPHAVPATGDKQRDRRRAEIARARATPILRRRDVALDDYVTDTSRVVGAKPFDVSLVRRLIAAGVRPVQSGRAVSVTPDAPPTRATLRPSYDADTTVADSAPSRAQLAAVAETKRTYQQSVLAAEIARTADLYADRLREAYAVRMFGLAYTDYWFELLPAKFS